MRDRDSRRTCGGDSGFTLVELLVAMTILIAVLAVVFTLLTAMSRQTADNMARAYQTNQINLGLAQIDRQVRSGNVISDPSLETLANSGVPANYSLRIYTQTNGTNRCAQWRVIFPPGQPRGQLQFRSWQPDWATSGVVSPWQVVANGLVAPSSASDAPFQRVAAAAGSKAQSVQVTLWVKAVGLRSAAAPTAIKSVLTGRNTVFGYPADECAAVPAP